MRRLLGRRAMAEAASGLPRTWGHRPLPPGGSEEIGNRAGCQRRSAILDGTASRGAKMVEDAADDAAFGDEGEQVLGGAIGTPDAGEASLEDAAVEVPRDHAVEEAAPEAIAALEEVFPGALDRLVEGIEQRVQGRLGGPARPICGCLPGTRPGPVSCRKPGNRASGFGTEASARVGDAALGRGDRRT